MRLIYPIYGFHATKPIDIGCAVVLPHITNDSNALKLSRDLNTFNLTGALVTEDSVSEEYLFNVEAALTFIDRRSVHIGAVKPFVGDDPFFEFETSICIHQRNDGGGEMIGRDTLFPSSRETFLRQVLQKLEDKRFCEDTQFKQLFFKCVEEIRQRTPFVEVSYFLLFSGLETFARAVMNERNSSQAAEPISKLLKKYGFNVEINRPNDLVRAVSTYAMLRNALFHRGAFIADTNINGIFVKLSLLDYLFNFTRLTNLVVLKAIEFDDGHINWDSWVDRQPFQ